MTESNRGGGAGLPQHHERIFSFDLVWFVSLQSRCQEAIYPNLTTISLTLQRAQAFSELDQVTRGWVLATSAKGMEQDSP